MITSGAPKLAGPWLQLCQRFVETLPATVKRIETFVAAAVTSGEDNQLQYLIADVREGLEPQHWTALFPRLPQTQTPGGADIATALKVTGVSFTTGDVPAGFSSQRQDTVTVDLRFLCQAALVPKLLDDEGYLRFGSWIDLTGQFIAVSVSFDGIVAGLQIDS